jgi:hypothetical protein
MSRTYRKRPIYDNKDLKFGNNRINIVNNEVLHGGRKIPAKHKVSHYEVEVSEVRVLHHDKHEIDVRYIPSKEEKVIHTSKRFLIPSILEISTYCQERKNEINAEQFYDHYQSNGWMVGKNKMKDWRAAVRTWEKNGYSKPQQSNNNQITTQNGTLQERKYAHVHKAIRNLERLGSLNPEQVALAKRYLEHATGSINPTEFIGKLVKYDSRGAEPDFGDNGDTLRIGT